MSEPFATTSTGVEIEAGDFLVVGRGKSADVCLVDDDGEAANDFGDGAVVVKITPDLVAAWEATEDLEVHSDRSAAHDELARRHGDPRWELLDHGEVYRESAVATLEEALDEAEAGVSPRDYPGSDGEGLAKTIWVTVAARNIYTGERGTRTVQVDPEEPRCESKEGHDWQSPHAIVGGDDKNPGVWGNRGGVIIKAVCLRCGCGKTTDTWAQNPETAEEGLTSVAYHPGRFADEVRSLRREEDKP